MPRPNVRQLALWVLALCSIGSMLACSSVEKITEKHTTHLIDAGDPINEGCKVLDDDEVLVVIYSAGQAIGTESRRLNGMRVATPNRFRELLIAERALRQYLNAHVNDSEVTREIDARLQQASAEIDH